MIIMKTQWSHTEKGLWQMKEIKWKWEYILWLLVGKLLMNKDQERARNNGNAYYVWWRCWLLIRFGPSFLLDMQTTRLPSRPCTLVGPYAWVHEWNGNGNDVPLPALAHKILPGKLHHAISLRWPWKPCAGDGRLSEHVLQMTVHDTNLPLPVPPRTVLNRNMSQK